MSQSENGFNRLPEPEIIPDKDTLKLVLSDIISEAMLHGVEVYLSNEVVREEAKKNIPRPSGNELDAAILDLNASVVRDSFEFEHQDGIRQGLQLVADRVSERMTQAESQSE